MGRPGGYKVTEETKHKISVSKKGKHTSSITEFKKGHSFSVETIEKMKRRQKENPTNFWKGKSRSEETKEKIKKALKGRQLPEEVRQKMLGRKSWNKGLTKEGDLRLLNMGFQKGTIFSKEHRRKLSEISKLRKFSEETRRKMSEKKIGHFVSNKTKERLRLSTIDYIKKTQGRCIPRMGRNEKEILDKLENELGFLIERGVFIGGFCVDGYCRDLNLVIEIDESYHNKNNFIKEKDKKRQQEIIEKVGCDFLRIKEKDYFKDKDYLLNKVKEIELK